MRALSDFQRETISRLREASQSIALTIAQSNKAIISARADIAAAGDLLEDCKTMRTAITAMHEIEIEGK